MTALSPGDAVVQASFESETDNADLTVTDAVVTDFQVIPGQVEGPQGTTEQLRSYAVFSNNDQREVTADTTWASSDSDIASVGNTASDKGLLSLKLQGSTQVKAAYGGEEYLVSVTVAAAQLVELQVAPASTAVAAGQTQQYTATGIYSDQTTSDLTDEVFWTSTDKAIASIDNSGLARTYTTGEVTITATESGSGLQQTAELSVTDALLQSVRIVPGDIEGPAGTRAVRQLIATYSDGSDQQVTEQASWTVQDSGVASVVNTGSVAGTVSLLSAGSTTLSAQFDGQSDTVDVTVTAALLTDLVVTPGQASIPDGTTQKFTATAYYGDNTSRDVSAEAAWTSSDGSVATVDPSSGLATGIGIGDTVITATFESSSDQADLEVTAATVDSLTVTPARVEGALGTSAQLTAEASYSNGTTQDVTTQAVWSSQDSAIASVSSGAAGGLVNLVGEGNTTVTASFGGADAAVPVTVTAAVLEQLVIAPEDATVAAGLTVQYTATGIYSDGSNQNLTDQVSWASSEQDVARIDNAGLATAGVPGDTTISATYNPPSGPLRALLNSVSASTALTVTDADVIGIQVDPVQLELPIGNSARLKLYAELSNGDLEEVGAAASWQSGDKTIVEVVPEGQLAGTVTARGLGTTPVTANYAGFSSAAQVAGVNAVPERFVVLPGEASVPAGNGQKFDVWAYYSDGSPRNVSAEAAWASSNNNVAVVDGEGNATTLIAGTSTISATFPGADGEVFKDSGVLIATAAVVIDLQISPRSLELPVGREQALTLTAYYSDGTNEIVSSQASWISSDSGVATVGATGSDGGLVRGTGEGTATITATYAGLMQTAGVTVNAAVLESITVSPQQVSVPLGQTSQFTALGTYSDGSTPDITNQVAWRSSDPALASIDQTGLASTIAEGTVTISASLDSVSGQAQLTITAATPVSIGVSPASIEGPVGTTEQLTATALFTDGSTLDVTTGTGWSSDNTAVAEVQPSGDSAGFVALRGEGTAVITATYAGVDPVSVPVTVSGVLLQSITIEPLNESVALGVSVQYSATGTYADNTTADITDEVTWRSSQQSVATIAQGGLATTEGEGSTTISAQLGDVSASTTLTVTSRVITDLQIVPPSITAPAGIDRPLLAAARFSDGMVEVVSSQAVWESSDPNVLVITNNADKDFVTAELLAAGSAIVKVSFSGLVDEIPVTVEAAVLDSLTIAPLTQSSPVGVEVQYVLTGIYSDGHVEDLTAAAQWSSDDSDISEITAPGKALAKAVGEATITASTEGQDATAVHQVTAAEVTELVVDPAALSDPAGTKQQFTATARFTDGGSADVTTVATWTSSNSTVASVIASGETGGLVTLLSPGQATITANYMSISETSSVTVTPAVVVDIFVEPYGETYPEDFEVQFTAIATYSDDTQSDVTDEASWYSEDPNVAVAGPGGVVHTVMEGSAGIVASLAGVEETGFAPVNVVPATLVGLQIEPGSVEAPAGAIFQMQATAFYNNDQSEPVTQQSIWASEDESVAVVVASGDEAGKLRLLAEGTTRVSATFGGITQYVDVVVTEAELVDILVQPANKAIALGTEQQYQAIGVYSDGSTSPLSGINLSTFAINLSNAVQWRSSNEAVATISSTGLTDSVSPGTTVISATQGDITGETNLTVEAKAVVSLEISPFFNVGPAGTTAPLAVNATYSDGSGGDVTSIVDWSSGNGSVATVSPGGLLSHNGEGATIITATLDGVNGNALVITLSGALESIVITPNPLVTPEGVTKSFTATGLYTDGGSAIVNEEADWSVADPGVATVSNVGVVTGVSEGTTTVTASLDGIIANATVQVEAAELVSVQIDPSLVAGPEGTIRQLKAIGLYSNGDNEDVTRQATWLSDDADVATVQSGILLGGLLTLVTEGTANVSVVVDEKTDTIPVEVTAATIVAVSIDPERETIPSGTQQQFVATAELSNGNFIVLEPSEDLRWESSFPLVAAIDQTGLATGLLPGLNSGMTQISATIDGVTGTAELIVAEAEVTRIDVFPGSLTEPAGTSGQLEAIATYSNTFTRDVTSEATWESSDPTVALVESCGAGRINAFNCQSGFTYLLQPGQADVTARFQGQEGLTSITVTEAVLESIVVSPATTTLAKGNQ